MQRAADAKYAKDFMTDPFMIGGSADVNINVANQIKQGVTPGNVRVMSKPTSKHDGKSVEWNC